MGGSSAVDHERTRTTYVVTNNHFEGKAVVNALQLLALLSIRGLPSVSQS